MTFALSTDVLSKLWPHALPGMIPAIAAGSSAVLAKYQLDTIPRLVAFISECSEETGGLTAVTESGRYSAERAHEVWPGLFPTAAAAAPFVVSEKTLFDKTYGGRYGNRPGTDDGYNFRGRGMIQITFRDEYEKIGTATGLDLLGDPDLVSAPEHILECAAAYWFVEGINAYVDKGDFVGEVRRISGGATNTPSRVQWRKICTEILTAEAVTVADPIPPAVSSVAQPAPAIVAAAQPGAKPMTDDPTPAAPAAAPAAPAAAPDLHNSPATDASAARVVPATGQPVRVPWLDAIEQLLVHEAPAIKAALVAGLDIAAAPVPMGDMLVGMFGQTIVNEAVDHVVTVVQGLDASGAGTITMPDNALATMAGNVINSTAPTFYAKAQSFLDGWFPGAIAAAKAKFAP